MKSVVWVAALMAAAACEKSPEQAVPTAAAQPNRGGPVDDGTFLERIDPLGGQWQVERLAGADFTRFNGWINFSAGGFLNHGAGCSGGYPAFYRLDDQRLTITRRERVRIGKCAAPTAAGRTEAAASERRLTAFLDQAATWERSDQRTLVLSARDGTQALLTRPIEPYPNLAGRWIIEAIGGRPLVTERRPPTLTIAMRTIGVVADCNSTGGPFTIPAPGRISVTTPIMSTAIGCAPEDAAEDSLMTSAITLATSYQVQGDRIILTGGPGLVARRPPPPNRQLAGEYQACGNTLLGGYHEGPITLAIDEKRMRDNAGCNADYRADGPKLVLQLGEGPACAAAATPFVPGEPVPIGGPISPLAVTRPDGFGFDDHERLILRTERGLLTMCRKGSPIPFGG